jgi:hypothetical protein
VAVANPSSAINTNTSASVNATATATATTGSSAGKATVGGFPAAASQRLARGPAREEDGGSHEVGVGVGDA